MKIISNEVEVTEEFGVYLVSPGNDPLSPQMNQIEIANTQRSMMKSRKKQIQAIEDKKHGRTKQKDKLAEKYIQHKRRSI